MIENVKKPREHVFEAILPGGVGEFVHEVGPYGSIYLRIPVDEVKNIQSAIVEAENEGLNAKVINSSGYEYLEIYKEGYDPADDTLITEKVKKVAKDVSTEDYSNHIKNLQLTPDEDVYIGNTQLMPLYKEEKEYGEKERSGIGEEVSEETQNDLAKTVNEVRNILLHRLLHTTVKKLEMLCKDLGIPIVSSAEELKKLNPNLTVIIFASQHDRYDTEPKELKKILLQKLENSDKKTILGFEFYSNKYFVDLFNDPTKNLNDSTFNELLSLAPFGKTVRGLIEVFNEIQQKYSRDRFEIKPFDVTYAESLESLKAEISGDREKVKELDEKRDAKIVENIRDLLNRYKNDNLVLYTGRLHVIDLLTKLKEIKESGNKEGIKIDNIVVYLPVEDLDNVRRK